MRCPKCGTENSDTFNNYCVYCGAFLEKKNEIEVVPRSDKGFKIFLIIMFAIIAFFGGFIGGKLLKNMGGASLEGKLNIPYALNDIKPGVKITKDLISSIEIDNDLIDYVSFLYNDKSLLNNNLCVKEGTKIVKGSYFYIDQLEKCKDNSAYRVLSFNISNGTYKYMKRGLYVDLYVKIDKKFDKLLENLKIEDINDRTVDILVPKEYESLINKAKDLKDVQIDLVLAKKTGNTSVKLSNKTLLDSLKKKVG